MLKNAQTTQPHVMASTTLCYVLVTSVWNREDPCSILLAWPQAAWESATLTALSALFRAAAAAKSLQSCPTLCDPIDGSPPGSPIPGILQARTLESVAISFSNALKWKVKVKSQLYPTLSDPMDHSLPGSSVHGIFQARVLEWSGFISCLLAISLGKLCIIIPIL